jgi:hypothetical protein
LGFAVPGKTMTTALTFLQGRFQAVGEGDNTTKAVILHAQSVAGAADFAYVNRLYRLRNAWMLAASPFSCSRSPI